MNADQEPVIALLSDPATHGGIPVERVDTHAAIVFLAGRRALKLKRAVRFDYLDFSTPERRREACEAEFRINRRTAPDIYRGVVAVTRAASGRLALGGPGKPVDWLVDMARFDQARLLDRLAASHALGLDVMAALASTIATFHREAAPRPDRGGPAAMRHVVIGNADGFAEQGHGVLDPAAAVAVTARTLRELDAVTTRLDARQREGFVRECHGDLHLRNIVLLDRPTLFDALEFNEELSCIDVFYDLAFLLMDLVERRLPVHANAVLNGYLAETHDLDGLRLLPLFLSCRAAVRAKTSATASRVQTAAAARTDLERQSQEYLEMATRLIHPPAPCLVAVGGLSGTGKSTLARAWAPSLGPSPGAVVVRSDELRKSMLGVPPLQRLGPDGYADAVTTRVYDAVASQVATVLRGGHAAIADAVFADPRQRAAIEAVARQAGVPFTGVWLDAPRDVLIARAGSRGPDPSDADAAVIDAQSTRPLGDIRWTRLDCGTNRDAVLQLALALTGAQCRSGA